MATNDDKLVTLADLGEAYTAATKVATQSAKGMMSATDKAKLDGIATGAQVNSITGVKGSAENNYRTGNINLTAANVGAKATQSAVSSPSASGTTTSFIDTISQNAQGVISATKKTVAPVSTSANGLMTKEDKAKLDGIATGAQVNSITGVKGSAENSYRTGNVNLTAANVGALPTAGGTMSGDINMGQNGENASGRLIYWTTADGTAIEFRPYNNLFQITRRPSGGTSSNCLGIYSNGDVLNNGVLLNSVTIGKVTDTSQKALMVYSGRGRICLVTNGSSGADDKGIYIANASNTGTYAIKFDSNNKATYLCNPASWKNCLTIGNETMNFSVFERKYQNASDIFALNGTVTNSTNTTKTGHNMSFVVSNDKLVLYDHTNTSLTWTMYPYNTRVKGDAEGSYRSGDVNITPQNIGASYRFYFGQDDTIAQILAQLQKMPSPYSATFGAHQYAAERLSGGQSNLSNGKITAAIFGVVNRTNSTTYRFVAWTIQNMYLWTVTTATATSTSLNNSEYNVRRFASEAL